MPIDWNAEVLDQIETHWRDQLRPRLECLTDAEHRWEPIGQGDPVPTIAWRLAHVTDGLAEMNDVHFGGAQFFAATYPEARGAAEALHRLDAEFATWVRGVRLLGAEGLGRPQGDTSPQAYADAPIVRVVLYTSVEIIHHGAEICLLRDLYRKH